MWDPVKYLDFADHRGRPFYDLISRVGAPDPRLVVDLGCGPGTLTGALRERWPGATVQALDSSPEMVAAARGRGIAAEVMDVAAWRPPEDADVVVCNAVLQWVPKHEELLRRWVGELPAGAWLAFQVPGNFGAPSHAIVRELAAGPRWRSELAQTTLRGEDAVLQLDGYAAMLTAAGGLVDAWETTYLQRLSGEDPVLEWISGTSLRPVKAALPGDRWAQFRADLAPRLRAAYPRRSDGGTWFPFRRIFVVARVPAPLSGGAA